MTNNLTRTVSNDTESGSERAISSLSTISRHPRYLSEWESNIVVLNFAHDLEDSTREYIINIDQMYISGEGGNSLVKEIVPLTQFPHLVDSFKFVLNFTVDHYRGGTLRQYIGSVTSNTLRIFSWMIRNNRHKLGDLTPRNIKTLTESVGQKGWWNTLDYDSALRAAHQRFLDDPNLAANLSKSHLSAVNHFFLAQQIGLPIVGAHLPPWFREFVASFDNKPSPAQPYKYRTGHLTGQASELESMLTLLQRYCILPAPFDCIGFVPFQSVGPEVKRITQLRQREAQAQKRSEADKGDQELPALPAQTETPNIPLPIAQKIFSQAVTWLYEYAAPVLAVLDEARKQVEKIAAHSPPLTNPKINFRKLNQILSAHKIPIVITSLSSERTDADGISLVNLVSTVFFSCAALILMNHGRRPQEAIGYRVPYGLYFGCVSSVCDQLLEKKIELYVEKSPRAYATFWCTKIVVDAVTLLEEIAQRFRPLFTPVKLVKDELVSRRSDKLFTQRVMSVTGFATPPMTFNWRENSALFFELANVDQSIFDGVQLSFRRLFMSLYVHRYDCPDLLDLKHHLCDMRMESLVAYFRDPLNRPVSQKLELSARKYQEEDSLELGRLFQEASSEYLQEKVTQLLHGESFGGAFPRIVRKIIKKLTQDTDFLGSSLQQKIDAVADEIEHRGYAADPKDSSVCMVGRNKDTRRNSNCFQNGEVHVERASPIVCSGCVHAFNPQSYINLFAEDRDISLAASQDKRLPSLLRQTHKQHAEEMTRIINLEMKMAEENTKALSEFIISWAETE